jgi:hypothetical protein
MPKRNTPSTPTTKEKEPLGPLYGPVLPGFEEQRPFNSRQRFEPLRVPLTDTAIRVEPGTRPQMEIRELADFIAEAGEYGNLKGMADSLAKSLAVLSETLIRNAQNHPGLRGSEFEQQDLTVTVMPTYVRKVKDHDRFREELGVMFTSVASRSLLGKIQIPEGLITKDGTPVSAEGLRQLVDKALSDMGISEQEF